MAMEGQSVFWNFTITIPIWFLVVIMVVAMAVVWYFIKEIRGLRSSLYSWRDLCEELESDDREIRRRDVRRLQNPRRRLTPSTYQEATEAETNAIVWTDRGPMNREHATPLRLDVLRSIGEHMQLDTRENTIFIRAFSELNGEDKEKMNECLINMLYFMNSGDEELVRQSFLAMGIIPQKIGARTLPLGSPDQEEHEDETMEEDGELPEDRRRRYLTSSMSEVSDVDYWMELHHHCEEGDSDEPMHENEESEEEQGPPTIDYATANANRRMDYEREVGEYQRRVVRRLHRCADRAEDHSNFEAAADLRRQANYLDYL